MRVKMESKKGKSAVCWIYQYSKKVALACNTVGAYQRSDCGKFYSSGSCFQQFIRCCDRGKRGKVRSSDFFDCMSDLAAGSFEYFEQ